MKTIPLTKPVARFRFPDELSAVIGDGLVLLRLNGPDDGATGEIVVHDYVEDATVQGVIDAHDPTPPTLHEQSMAAFNDALVAARLVDRAIVLSAMDSDNVLRKFTRDLLTQIAAATSLADLKTRCANNLPVLAALDGADAKAAIGAKINGGGAD